MPATPITLWLGCGATLLHGLWEKKGHHPQCERRWWKTGLVLGSCKVWGVPGRSEAGTPPDCYPRGDDPRWPLRDDVGECQISP